MQQIQSTLYHKIHPPQKYKAGEFPTLILLHGRGANEDDLLSLAEYLDDRLLIVAVRAPFAFPVRGGHTWYDVLEV